MANIGTKINLTAFKNATILKMGKTQIDCIVIPIDQNNFYKSDKGAIYLDMIGFENKEVKYGQTHLVKQSLPKEVREKMTPEDQKEMPILGNHSIIGGQANEAVPTVAATEDDLPF